MFLSNSVEVARAAFQWERSTHMSVKICPTTRTAEEYLSVFPVIRTIDNFRPGTEVLRRFLSRIHHLKKQEQNVAAGKSFQRKLVSWLQ